MLIEHALSERRPLRGILLVALSGTLFGFMAILGTKLFECHLSLENMLFWRFLVATLWMLGSALSILKANDKKRVNRAPFIRIFLFCGVSYSGCSAFYFMASREIGTGLAMVIFFSFPVFVALFSWLFGHFKMNKQAFASLTAVVIGLIFLQSPNTKGASGLGILFGLMASLSYAIYVYGSQHTIKSLDSKLLTFLVCLGNTLIFFSLSCYTGRLSLPQTATAWFYVAAIGIIATALPIQLLLDGLKDISPVKASLLSVLEPIVTLLIGFFFLEETLTTIQSLGVFILLIGALAIQFERAN